MAKPLDQLSPAYRKRIENALAKGKSRQAARGHKPREHVARREREIEELGITSSQISIIRRWISKYSNKDRSEDDVIDFARENGYDAFKVYRATWDAARRQYLKELMSGEYSSRGIQYLEFLAGSSGVDNIEWLYYH